ncbi:MAG TPA: hypothetical protein VLH60_05075 [Sedimentisphaerales bacterium]|nr:hypothetical protein [Sedimentisphaerales bacterium]
MPLPLSSVAIAEKNKLATNSAFLLLLQIIIPGEASALRFVDNTDDITWAGHTWQRFGFKVEQIREGANEVPQTVLAVDNIAPYMRQICQAYDHHLKTSGVRLIETRLYIVNTAALAANPDCAAVDTYVFQISNIRLDHSWVYFTLSASNPYRRRFPQHRILKDGCRFAFRGPLCGYAGTEIDCDRTLRRCRELGNSSRFGAFPGVGHGGVVVTSR